MANEQNLKNGEATRFRSGEEAVENGRKGGIASGEARRRKKARAEVVDRIISAPLDAKSLSELEKLVGEVGEDDATLYALTFAKMLKKAAKGDVNAFNAVNRTLEHLDKLRPAEYAGDEGKDPLSKALEELGGSL